MATKQLLQLEERIRGSFERQRLMTDLGARLAAVRVGEVDVELPFAERLTQQHGFIHGGLVATITDTACVYAALTVMPLDAAVLTVEYKINFLAPARGGSSSHAVGSYAEARG